MSLFVHSFIWTILTSLIILMTNWNQFSYFVFAQLNHSSKFVRFVQLKHLKRLSTSATEFYHFNHLNHFS